MISTVGGHSGIVGTIIHVFVLELLPYTCTLLTKLLSKMFKPIIIPHT